MKIAIACEGKVVSAHFGHCEGFIIYNVENGTVVSNEFKPNPGHRPGFLPVYLKEQGADVIIAGGMGETAQMLFNENGIDVVVGAQGDCEDVLDKYLKGELKSTGSVCREHQHEGHCH